MIGLSEQSQEQGLLIRVRCVADRHRRKLAV